MNKHNMLRHISWTRRAEIARNIEKMPIGTKRTVLECIFIHEMNSTETAECSGVSKRRVQQIAVEFVPEYALKARPAGKHSKKRADHARIRDHAEKKPCAFCGRTEQLELHHMIPLFLGGTDDAANLVWLCEPCHAVVTSYQREHFKNEWYAESEVCANV